MNNSGDAAEQVVRLSLEGLEVAARLSGSAAKNIAILLVSVLKEEQKTKRESEAISPAGSKRKAKAKRELPRIATFLKSKRFVSIREIFFAEANLT